MSMIVIIYFFVSCGQQSDARGGLGFCGYILWFMSMIVIIYSFVSGGQHSDAGGDLGFCGYHLHQRRFRRNYLSTNPSPHDPQNVLLAQTYRPMKTPGRIFSIIPSCQSD